MVAPAGVSDSPFPQSPCGATQVADVALYVYADSPFPKSPGGAESLMWPYDVATGFGVREAVRSGQLAEYIRQHFLLNTFGNS